LYQATTMKVFHLLIAFLMAAEIRGECENVKNAPFCVEKCPALENLKQALPPGQLGQSYLQAELDRRKCRPGRLCCDTRICKTFLELLFFKHLISRHLIFYYS
jgi:hypothetical protein